jgi:hypothetical protein
MHPVSFEGAVEIKKPENMTDEECTSVWATSGFGTLWEIFKSNGAAPLPPGAVAGIDSQGLPYYMTAWQPNKEDIDAINRGEPIYVKTVSMRLPPMALFTLDENGNGNF